MILAARVLELAPIAGRPRTEEETSQSRGGAQTVGSLGAK